MGQVGTKERDSESDLGFSQSLRRSCDRRGKLDVEDCSSECLYIYDVERGWYVNTIEGAGETGDFSKISRCVKNGH